MTRSRVLAVLVVLLLGLPARPAELASHAWGAPGSGTSDFDGGGGGGGTSSDDSDDDFDNDDSGDDSGPGGGTTSSEGTGPCEFFIKAWGTPTAAGPAPGNGPRPPTATTTSPPSAPC